MPATNVDLIDEIRRFKRRFLIYFTSMLLVNGIGIAVLTVLFFKLSS